MATTRSHLILKNKIVVPKSKLINLRNKRLYKLLHLLRVLKISLRNNTLKKLVLSKRVKNSEPIEKDYWKHFSLNTQGIKESMILMHTKKIHINQMVVIILSRPMKMIPLLQKKLSGKKMV